MTVRVKAMTARRLTRRIDETLIDLMSALSPPTLNAGHQRESERPDRRSLAEVVDGDRSRLCARS